MKGVKQGDVLPPILFALYTDELLERLEQTKLGCHLGCRLTRTLRVL